MWPVRPCVVAGASVQACLAAAFALYPKLRGYVLDEHGALRFHMAIFVDGEPIADRRGLSDSVSETGEIFVLQALSGG